MAQVTSQSRIGSSLYVHVRNVRTSDGTYCLKRRVYLRIRNFYNALSYKTINVYGNINGELPIWSVSIIINAIFRGKMQIAKFPTKLFYVNRLIIKNDNIGVAPSMLIGSQNDLNYMFCTRTVNFCNIWIVFRHKIHLIFSLKPLYIVVKILYFQIIMFEIKKKFMSYGLWFPTHSWLLIGFIWSNEIHVMIDVLCNYHQAGST